MAGTIFARSSIMLLFVMACGTKLRGSTAVTIPGNEQVDDKSMGDLTIELAPGKMVEDEVNALQTAVVGDTSSKDPRYSKPDAEISINEQRPENDENDATMLQTQMEEPLGDEGYLDDPIGQYSIDNEDMELDEKADSNMAELMEADEDEESRVMFGQKDEGPQVPVLSQAFQKELALIAEEQEKSRAAKESNFLQDSGAALDAQFESETWHADGQQQVVPA